MEVLRALPAAIRVAIGMLQIGSRFFFHGPTRLDHREGDRAGAIRTGRGDRDTTGTVTASEGGAPAGGRAQCPPPLVIAQFVAGPGVTVRSTSSPTPILVRVRLAGEVA